MAMKSYQRRYTAQTTKATSARGNYGKLGKGSTVIRLMPFTHTVHEGDFQLGRYVKGEVQVGEVTEELYVQHRKHWNVAGNRPVVCGLMRGADGRWIGDCEICDRVRDWRNGGDDEQKLAQRQKADTKYTVNAVIITEEEDQYEIKLLDLPKTVMDKIMSALENKRFKGKNLFGMEGRDFEIVKNPDAAGVAMYADSGFLDAEDSVDLEGKVIGEPIDLLNFRALIHEQFHSYLPDDRGDVEQGDDDSPAPKPAAKKKATRKKKATAKKKEEADPVVVAFPVGSEWAMTSPDNGETTCEVIAHLKDQAGATVIHVKDAFGVQWNVEEEDLSEVTEADDADND